MAVHPFPRTSRGDCPVVGSNMHGWYQSVRFDSVVIGQRVFEVDLPAISDVYK